MRRTGWIFAFVVALAVTACSPAKQTQNSGTGKGTVIVTGAANQ